MRTHTHTHTHARTHAHTHARTHARTYTHTHTHTNTHTNTPVLFFRFGQKPTLSTCPGLGHSENTCFNTSGSGGQARREACGLPATARCAPHTELHGLVTRCNGFRCKPTECFIVQPIKHCHRSLQPIAPTHFARIQPRPNGLRVGERPHAEVALEPSCTRCEVLLL